MMPYMYVAWPNLTKPSITNPGGIVAFANLRCVSHLVWMGR